MTEGKITPPYHVAGYEKIGSYTESDDGDRQVLAQLVESGSDLRCERHSIHYFYFENKSAALAAADELQALGFQVKTGESLEKEPASRLWPVTADRTEVINEEVISALRRPMTEIAERHGGEYDGWEAAVDQ